MEQKKSVEYDGKLRTLFLVPCQTCGKEVWIPKFAVGRRKYCSVGCKSENSKNRVTVECAQCGKPVVKVASRTSRSGLFFCDRKCKEQAQKIGGLTAIHPAHYTEEGCSDHYRVVARRTYKAECVSCGYAEQKKMLDVDHIDGNHSNNAVDNLQILCVWCHAKKTRAAWPEPAWK